MGVLGRERGPGFCSRLGHHLQLAPWVICPSKGGQMLAEEFPEADH